MTGWAPGFFLIYIPSWNFLNVQGAFVLLGVKFLTMSIAGCLINRATTSEAYVAV